jgi:LCP family protein required for cell wall assembly
MRTTLKRGVGRAAHLNGNGHSVVPPTAVEAVTHYEQPPGRSKAGLVGRSLLGLLLLAVAAGAGVGGGAYLWAHQSVEKIQAHTPAVVKAQKALDIPIANEPATALVIGYDHRAGVEANRPSLSDTLMLIRADPTNKTISLLSLPRDLTIPIYCGPTPVAVDRINSAYSRCGPNGTLLTIKHLTGLPIQYLITVNFHGFKEVVDQLGGVWMDVDRRYYNRNVGTSATDYANIDLQPGYQRLDGEQALDFVRFRHTDSDLFRVARQQEFVRSFREQVAQNFSASKVPALVNAISSNIEVAEGGRKLQLSEIEKYAFFAYGLPTGHVFQDQIQNVQCQNQCYVAQSDIDAAVQLFTNPDLSSSKAANAAALGKKLKSTTPPPSSVTMTVLNGNGVAGAASNASYLFATQGYKVILPPHNLEPNAPPKIHPFHTKVYYDATQARAKAAATALAKLIAPADVLPLPARGFSPKLRALDPGSKLLVVLGQTFHGTITPVTTQPPPVHVPPVVRSDDVIGRSLLEPLIHMVPFRLETPTVLEQNSYPDTAPGDTPVRLYDIVDKQKAVRLVFRTGGNEYWGIEETSWGGAPALADRSFRHDLGGREFDLYYSGSHLEMVVLHGHGASYWVVNTLRDSLSNETMLAIAKGLKPLTAKS